MTAAPPNGPAQAVLDYWLGDALTLGWPSQSRTALWFGGGSALDQEITQRFGDRVRDAVGGGLGEWEHTPLERLALIVLLDQFTRNVFRGQAQAFAGDARACALSLDLLRRRWLTELPLAAQVFACMPLEHAESLPIQDLCVAQFEQIHARAPQALQVELQGYLASAQEHRQIVATFGRFPHRNAVLGRASTDAETDWLRNGKRFGQ